jgi:hypothetical protein
MTAEHEPPPDAWPLVVLHRRLAKYQPEPVFCAAEIFELIWRS